MQMIRCFVTRLCPYIGLICSILTIVGVGTMGIMRMSIIAIIGIMPSFVIDLTLNRVYVGIASTGTSKSSSTVTFSSKVVATAKTHESYHHWVQDFPDFDSWNLLFAHLLE